jgi:hypothetical protein
MGSQLSAATSDWPMEIDSNEVTIVVYQPQLESLDRNLLRARSAVSVEWPEKGIKDYAAIWFSARIDADKVTRIVKLTDLKITKLSYPNQEQDIKVAIAKIVKKEILSKNLTISVDRLVGMMNEIKRKTKGVQDIKHPVPELFFSTEPAILVHIAGEPKLKKLNDNYEQVLNTDFLLLKSLTDEFYYLNAAGMWFKSKELLKGWEKIDETAELTSIAKQQGVNVAEREQDTVPKIYVSTKESELIQSYGPPKLSYIPGTNLSYLENSDNDLFRDEESGMLFLLLSGRWFTAAQKEGPWKYIPSSELPKDFMQISESSDKAHVLASIAGTDEANDAIAESYIPHTATISKEKFEYKPQYDGNPKFEEVDGVPNLFYAVNTADQCVRLDSKYYLCYKGAWYSSSSPHGPWYVCSEVPDEIYNIPPSNPLYNTTYVEVYDDTPGYIEVGYTPGYYCSYIYRGILLYGSGYYYKWWCQNFRCPRFTTYGHRYKYDNLDCRWYRYDRFRTKYGDYVDWNNDRHSSTILPPRQVLAHKVKERVAEKYDFYKSNPTVIKDRVQEIKDNIKNNLSPTQKKQLLKTALTRKAATRPVITKPKKLNNVYVTKDGKIYKHDINGWKKYENKKWDNVKLTRPSSSVVNTKLREQVRENLSNKLRSNPSISVPKYKTPTSSSIRLKSELIKSYQSRQRGTYRVQRSTPIIDPSRHVVRPTTSRGTIRSRIISRPSLRGGFRRR